MLYVTRSKYAQKHIEIITCLQLNLNLPSFTGRSTDCMHQKDQELQHCIPAVCYTYTQCSPSLSRFWSQCQKWQLLFVEPRVKINGQYRWNIRLSQEMLANIKHIADDNFDLQRDGVPSAVQLLRHETLNFISFELWFQHDFGNRFVQRSRE